jgi:bifunctional non-homologous end joining protein LigD
MPRIEVETTHPDRVLFPDDGITKGDLVSYYAEIAPIMLPHLKGRPLMLQRFPRGIDEQGFVQKDFEDALPDWMSWIEVEKQNGTVVHAVADRPEALECSRTRTASRRTRGSRSGAASTIPTG